MAPVVAAAAAVGSALSTASMAIGAAIGLGTGIAAGVVGGVIVGGVLGAATSAICGGDIEKGAIFGAVGGAVAGGFAGANSIAAAQNAAAGATSGAASTAASGMGSAAALGAAPEAFSFAPSMAGAGPLGSAGYSLGGEGILAGIQQAGSGFGAGMAGAAGQVGLVGAKTTSDMASFLAATKEAAASQTKWMMGTEAIKMGAGALLEKEDTSAQDALNLQQQAIDSKKIKLSGVEVPRAQAGLAGAAEAGGVASSLANLRNKGLLGGTAGLLGGYDYGKRIA